MPTTPLSLLERLRKPGQPTASADWSRLVDLFAPLLFHWSRQRGLAESDAADLVQDVFVKLLNELPTFQHRGPHSFRAWLRTLLFNLYCDRWRHGESFATLRGDPPVPDPRREQDVKEYRTYLAQQALRVMKRDFEPATWRACWETKVRGRSAADVGVELGLTVPAVHAATYRVLKRLREELQGFLE